MSSLNCGLLSVTTCDILLCRFSLFENCFELTPVFSRFDKLPKDLSLECGVQIVERWSKPKDQLMWVKHCHKPPTYGDLMWFGGWFIIVLPTLYRNLQQGKWHEMLQRCPPCWPTEAAGTSWCQATPGRRNFDEVWWNGYGSIPINTIFNGMNIHKSQLFWCELQGYKVLTHCQMSNFVRLKWRHEETTWDYKIRRSESLGMLQTISCLPYQPHSFAIFCQFSRRVEEPNPTVVKDLPQMRGPLVG